MEEELIKKHQLKRKRKKIKLAVIGSLITLIATVLIVTYVSLSKDEYINYKENANVNYKVNLKENEFYENDYIEEGTNIVASLIKNIETEFKYELELDEEIEYIYDYKIVAELEVKEKNKQDKIYNSEEELINREAQEAKNKKLEINEKITTDYNEYNQKINKFINLYKLDNTVNTLTLNMYLNVTSKAYGEQINKNTKVMKIEIPLTTKTVDISIATNVVKDNGEILARKSEYANIKALLIIGMMLLIIGVAVLIKFVRYVLETRSAETMYAQELKAILMNYKSYIQKINTEMKTENYEVIEINSFTEILEMRDTVQAPILMYQENELRTKFILINDNRMFVYILGAKEIREKLREKARNKQRNNPNDNQEEKQNNQ